MLRNQHRITPRQFNQGMTLIFPHNHPSINRRSLPYSSGIHNSFGSAPLMISFAWAGSPSNHKTRQQSVNKTDPL
jgi:hypothetical protein